MNYPNIQNILSKYDLDSILEVLNDRARDYFDECEMYEEEYPGQMEKEPYLELYYECGFGKYLKESISLIEELQQLNKSSK